MTTKPPASTSAVTRSQWTRALWRIGWGALVAVSAFVAYIILVIVGH
jgi:hypothetical protein